MKTKVKKLLCLLLAFVMVMGIAPISALATEVTVPDGWYKVTVKVAPSEANVKFYSDSDAATEITDNVSDDGIVGGYHQYTFVAEEGTYSYRAWEGEQFLGGMEFKVPIADEYASDGTLMGKGQVLTLKRVNFVTASGVITETEDYTIHLLPQDLAEAVNGTNYINESGNVVCPIMVNAGGNALTYNMVVDINGELGDSYAVAPLQNLTFAVGTETESRTFSVDSTTWFTITAPKEAKAQMFLQKNNFNVSEILEDESKKETLEDGTVKHYFATPGGNALTYRVSMKDKVTRAGFATKSNKDMVFTFGENENPKSTRTSAARIENNSLLNINAQNNLRLDAGEIYRLRSFRAGWQIINTDTENIMIEPDFHYNVISGGEHINLVPVDKCTGNAGSGLNANWIDIEAVSAGTAIIEVSYDAIEVGGSTSYPGTFGAVDPSRKSVVVITVGGGKDNTLQITPINGTRTGNTWDADFDTLYYTEGAPDFNFKATIGGGTPDKIEISTDLGGSWNTVTPNADGLYEAKNLSAGSNILRVTSGSKVEYQVIRAAKLKVTVVNLTRGGDKIIAGDSVRVVFSGIYTPIPKMSGIYNPTFGGNPTSVRYTVPSGVTASNSGTQYGFAADNEYNLTFSEAGTYQFTNGYISESAMGDEPGGHRLLTDSGRGVNFNAKDSSRNNCIMPDLTFEVMEMPNVKVTVVSDPEGASIELKDENDTVIEAGEDGTYSLEYGTYSYSLMLDGYVPEKGKFVVGGDDYVTGEKTVVITMRPVGGAIWDGSTLSEPQADEDGVYLIGTGPELAWYASNHDGASAKLTADISLGGYSVQISELVGTFDGNGYYVTDLYGSRSLFYRPSNGAVIKNLGVEGVIVQDTSEWMDGQGGIVSGGYKSVQEFTVENCVSRVDISGPATIGGIVGYAHSDSSIQMPMIISCYNAGSVEGNGSEYTGGIAGYKDYNPCQYIKNCYNIGTVSGDNAYGIAISGRGTNRNNYTLLGSAPTAGGTALAADALKTYAETLGDAYMDNPTSYNDGFPILKWEEPRALVVAQKEYPAELDAYKANESYDEAGTVLRTQAVEEGKAAIEAAATLEDAKTALDQAKAVIDAIETVENQDSEEEKVLLGDVNGDDVIDGRDVVRLRKYTAGMEGITIVEVNAEVTGDDIIDGRDVVRLRKFTAGMDDVVLE